MPFCFPVGAVRLIGPAYPPLAELIPDVRVFVAGRTEDLAACFDRLDQVQVSSFNVVDAAVLQGSSGLGFSCPLSPTVLDAFGHFVARASHAPAELAPALLTKLQAVQAHRRAIAGDREFLVQLMAEISSPARQCVRRRRRVRARAQWRPALPCRAGVRTGFFCAAKVDLRNAP